MTSVLDSILLQNNFSTPAIRSIWSDDNKISKQLAVEAALAKIEGDLGIIPKSFIDCSHSCFARRSWRKRR